MAVRPPQQGSSDPESIEFGIAALNARLDESEVQFPATKREILRQLDNTDVPYDASGNTVSLSEAFESIPRDRFETETELLDVLHPVFEEYRISASGSLFGRLRALLPF
jgi:hypothetical protein